MIALFSNSLNLTTMSNIDIIDGGAHEVAYVIGALKEEIVELKAENEKLTDFALMIHKNLYANQLPPNYNILEEMDDIATEVRQCAETAESAVDDETGDLAVDVLEHLRDEYEQLEEDRDERDEQIKKLKKEIETLKAEDESLKSEKLQFTTYDGVGWVGTPQVILNGLNLALESSHDELKRVQERLEGYKEDWREDQTRIEKLKEELLKAKFDGWREVQWGSHHTPCLAEEIGCLLRESDDTKLIKKIFDELYYGEYEYVIETETYRELDEEESDEEESDDSCVICGEEDIGYGNNAMPVKEGQCCNQCNTSVVIPSRIKQMREAFGTRGHAVYSDSKNK